jgi:membrane AbrB-like protein
LVPGDVRIQSPQHRVSVPKIGRHWAGLVALSLVFAALLEWAAFPAALLLGPMIAGIVFGVRGTTLRGHAWTLIAVQAVIGCLIAKVASGAILETIAADWPLMLLVVMTTIVASGFVGWLMVRFGALPGTTAAWGSSPGAASAMVAMAGEFGADIRLVAFMQYLRVVLVVLTASLVSRLLLGATAAPAGGAAPWFGMHFDDPLLPTLETLAIAAVGGWLGRRSRIPAGPLLVTIAIGAALHAGGWVEITLPPWLLAIVYAGLGWYVGLGFNRDVILYAFRAVPQLLLATFMIIGLCALSAWLLVWLLAVDPLTAYLATSPGGLDSVTIIAIGSRADVAFVLAIQTLRVFMVVLTGPPIAKLISRYA